MMLFLTTRVSGKYAVPFYWLFTYLQHSDAPTPIAAFPPIVTLDGKYRADVHDLKHRKEMSALTLFAQRWCRHTASHFPNASRRLLSTSRESRYASVTDSDLTNFRSIVGAAGVITDTDDLMAFNSDWMGRYHGRSRVALRPRHVEQVSRILQYCNERCIPIVPQGGNTGLVGGSVPVSDEVVLSLSAMNRILSFDDASGVVVAEAGVVLDALETYVANAGYRVPLDLGAKGSCQIGGNVATNAGGSRFIRYGSLRASVLGIEAVLPDGRILDTLTQLRKDNTGYDLKQLLIGAEGTLGVITKIAMACPPRSASVITLVVRVDDYKNVPRLLQMAKTHLGEVLSAYEFMDTESVRLAVKHLSHVSNPLQASDAESSHQSGSGYVLVECAGSNATHNREKVDNFVEHAFETGTVSDGVIAENETQASALWELRESLPEAVSKAGTGGSLKYDISLPLSVFDVAIRDARQRVAHVPGVEVVGWGHIGDGNLHLNVAVKDKEHMQTIKDLLEPWVYEFVAENRGSVSAEHGLGQMKAHAIHYSKSNVAVDVMHTLKNALDANGICNPYKVLPTTATKS